MFNTNRYIHFNIKVCYCVTITVIHNISGWKSGTVFCFYQNFICLFLRFAVQFSQLRQLENMPDQTIMQNIHCISNLNLSVKPLGLQHLYLWETYSPQNPLLPFKAFIRHLHRASMQKTNCTGADPTSSSSCGWRDEAPLEDIRHVRPLMSPNSCTSPAPQRPHSLWTFYLDPQSTAICCWSRQLSCSRHHSEEMYH